MPTENPSEVACTAAIDLLDVRCNSREHPHRGAHHATGRTVDGDRWSVFWHLPDDSDRNDHGVTAEPSQPVEPVVELTAGDVQLATRRLPQALRRRGDR